MGSNPEDRLLAEQCLQGDAAALSVLRDRFHGALTGILRARGADPTEAEDTLADLWSDCVPGDDDRPSLLEKYHGNGPLQGWFGRVAINRWIDKKRRSSRETTLDDPDRPERAAPESGPSDEVLLELLRASLQSAFGRCEPQAIVLLRLRHMHEIKQREMATMLGWSEHKIHRFLSGAMEQIKENTLRELKKREPSLELGWQDFVDLCAQIGPGFF